MEITVTYQFLWVGRAKLVYSSNRRFEIGLGVSRMMKAEYISVNFAWAPRLRLPSYSDVLSTQKLARRQPDLATSGSLMSGDESVRLVDFN